MNLVCARVCEEKQRHGKHNSARQTQHVSSDSVAAAADREACCLCEAACAAPSVSAQLHALELY
jgi:hypothetical protein